MVHIRKPTADEGLRDGRFTAEGYPTPLGNVAMDYVRRTWRRASTGTGAAQRDPH